MWAGVSSQRALKCFSFSKKADGGGEEEEEESRLRTGNRREKEEPASSAATSKEFHRAGPREVGSRRLVATKLGSAAARRAALAGSFAKSRLSLFAAFQRAHLMKTAKGGDPGAKRPQRKQTLQWPRRRYRTAEGSDESVGVGVTVHRLAGYVADHGAQPGACHRRVRRPPFALGRGLLLFH
ncbi:cyclin-dependent kinase 4 inhibitor C isoform X2 [Rhineura floridana]|uniref:cyclin-dependent kinase 4 inhibitor C isoform X2 n=1 Tax=Rhineura floridana TaxID=261503 RepID=UPI002AC84C4F|nr:cyclin-dependent kinase 4 inhibitor C isoform X2 [Rhineura floridana]